MGRTRQQESALDRAVVDYLEALVLRTRTLARPSRPSLCSDATADHRSSCPTPAVVAWVESDLGEPGTTIEVRLTQADPDTRTVRFEI